MLWHSAFSTLYVGTLRYAGTRCCHGLSACACVARCYSLCMARRGPAVPRPPVHVGCSQSMHPHSGRPVHRRSRRLPLHSRERAVAAQQGAAVTWPDDDRRTVAAARYRQGLATAGRGRRAGAEQQGQGQSPWVHWPWWVNPPLHLAALQVACIRDAESKTRYWYSHTCLYTACDLTGDMEKIRARSPNRGKAQAVG